jgi:hypothetical protein
MSHCPCGIPLADPDDFCGNCSRLVDDIIALGPEIPMTTSNQNQTEVEFIRIVRELIRKWDLLAVEKMCNDRLAVIDKCTCGNPHLTKIVHCYDKPCYVEEFK